jgi:hypothetical protein
VQHLCLQISLIRVFETSPHYHVERRGVPAWRSRFKPLPVDRLSWWLSCLMDINRLRSLPHLYHITSLTQGQWWYCRDWHPALCSGALGLDYWSGERLFSRCSWFSSFVIFSLVLCGCETWSVTLRKEHRLRVFKNRVLDRRGEVGRGWRKLHNEEVHNLYASPIITRVIKWTRVKGQVM